MPSHRIMLAPVVARIGPTDAPRHLVTDQSVLGSREKAGATFGSVCLARAHSTSDGPPVDHRVAAPLQVPGSHSLA